MSRVPAFLDGAPFDPRLRRRAGRSRRARRARRSRLRRARAASLASVALRDRRHRRGQARARGWNGRALAHRPRGRRRRHRPHRRFDRSITPQDRGRACSRSRLPHLGRPRPLSRRDATAGRVGHGACFRSAQRSRTSWLPPPTAGSRRVGSRPRFSAPKPRAMHSRSTRRGSRTRWCSSAFPTRRTSVDPGPRSRSPTYAPSASNKRTWLAAGAR